MRDKRTPKDVCGEAIIGTERLKYLSWVITPLKKIITAYLGKNILYAKLTPQRRYVWLLYTRGGAKNGLKRSSHQWVKLSTGIIWASITPVCYNPCNVIYYMATIVHVLWLAAKRALFFKKNRALVARCPRHKQAVFNLIVGILMDNHLIVMGKVSADQCHMMWRDFLSCWFQIDHGLRPIMKI